MYVGGDQSHPQRPLVHSGCISERREDTAVPLELPKGAVVERSHLRLLLLNRNMFYLFPKPYSVLNDFFERRRARDGVVVVRS